MDEMCNFIANLSLRANNFGHHKYNISASCNEGIIGDFEMQSFLDGEEFISVNGKSCECLEGDFVLISFKVAGNRIEGKRPGYLPFLNTILIQITVLVLMAVNTSGINSDLISYESRCSAEKAIIDKSMEYIYENMSKSINVRDICCHLYVSEPYLYKCFAKVLNLPPNQLIQLIKIKQAEQLIKTSYMNIKEISEALGFCSPFLFQQRLQKIF